MSLRTLVVTAGPTREYLDPVRFLSNPSTGKMGFAIAEIAAKRGWQVTLIAGPVQLKTPKGVQRIDVVSAREMLAAVKAALPAQVFIATAAVADWRPKHRAAKKLKKHEMSATLELARNPDILKTAHCDFKVGFAAETGDPAAEAVRKCRTKKLKFIVANDVSEKGSGFGSATNRVTIVRADGSAHPLPLLTKHRVAGKILDEIEHSFTA